jgi:Tol biopolymer transport system component
MSVGVTSHQLYVAPTNMPGGAPATAKPLFPGPAQHSGGAFSPDGRWIAYHSDESGRYEVYVSAWSSDGPVGEPLQVSDAGGWWATWAPDGTRLYYLNNRSVMVSSITTRPSLASSPPRVAWNMDSLRIAGNTCDILPDGRLLAIQRAPEEDELASFDLTVNFFDELKEKLSAARRSH